MYDSQPDRNGVVATRRVEPEPSFYKRTAEGEYVLPWRDILQTLWSRAWLVTLVTILCTGVALALSLLQTPVYEASAKILVGQGQQEQVQPGTNQNIWAPDQLTQTMVEGIKSRPVADAIVQDLGLQVTPEGFLGHLRVEQVPKSQFIQVTYTDTSPERAQQMANAVGEVFPKQVSQINPSQTALFAVAWEQAGTPTAPVSPKPERNAVVGLIIGLILGAALALLLEYLDDRWRSPEEAERISGAPTLGMIPEGEDSRGKRQRIVLG